MQQGHDKVVTVLLENDTRGKVRLPALHIAAKKDDVKAAKLLLEVSLVRSKYLQSYRNNVGFSRMSTIQMLLRNLVLRLFT